MQMQDKPQIKQKKRILSVFSLVMINVIAVDSIRTLPMAATYGLSLVTLYLLGAILFLVPTALITAELSTTWPMQGGMYYWVKTAFGPRWGYLTVYLQWIYNIVWYPTILTLIAGTLVYLIKPTWIDNPYYMVGAVLSVFWLCTLLNLFGMRISSLVSTLGSLFGTLGPMFLIIGLSLWWILSGKPSQIAFSLAGLKLNLPSIHSWVFSTAIIYSLLGLEMASVHATEVKTPAKDYPKALLISVIIIFFSLTLASLAIALVVPKNELDIVAGIIQAFSLFFEAFNLAWMKPVIVFFLVLGGIGAVATWIIGPTKGLFAAAKDGLMPKVLQKTNRFGVPKNMLLLQGLIGSLMTSFYVLLPSVKSAYWALSALAAQLSMLMYVLLFLSVIVLRYKQPNVTRPFQIPGGKIGLWCVSLAGLAVACSIVFLGFVPPAGIDVGNIWLYEGTLVGGIAILLFPVIQWKKQAVRVATASALNLAENS
ncbi:MAG TPA: amino acid permease [Gammaproteobacteria bacterium]|nr:amino acid permease [Gammaproteobacteria bacterium]